MTNLKVGKQLFPRSAFIGFDHLFNELEYATRHANDHYPPHNIVRTREEIDVEQKERSLTISGKHESRDREVIHRGISTKPFKRQFRLSEYVLVTGASLKDGILAVTLKMEIPKEKQPRSIKIT